VDSISQIIKSYTRGHNLAVRELETAAWADEDLAISERVEGLQCPKQDDGQLIVSPGTKILIRLRSMWLVKKIYNISHIEAEFGISDLANQVWEFLEYNVYDW